MVAPGPGGWMKITLTLMLVSSSIAEFPTIPIIDVGPWMARETPHRSLDNSTTTSSTLSIDEKKIVDEVLEACRTVGFFSIVNHGVDSNVVENMWNASTNFFNLPLEEKMKHNVNNDAEYPYGYEQKEELSKGKALDKTKTGYEHDDFPIVESKETFAIGPNNERSGMPLRRWMNMDNVPDFQSSLESYYTSMESLALRLLELFALALDQHISFFEGKMDHHMSALRLIHYYPLEEVSEESPRKIIRAGAHTDYGALTILNAGQSGLQVLRYDQQNRNRTEWFSVPMIPNALIINLGDLMQRWTNDEWVSTLHRVVMTSGYDSLTGELERRYSLAYFVNINGDTKIDTLTTDDPKYPTILARDHLMAKHLASMGVVSDHDEL